MLTQTWQVVAIYAAWVALSSLALWPLANWSARRKMLVSVLVVTILVTIICVTLLAHAFTATMQPPHTGFELLLATRAPPLLLSFLVWPFLTCIATAQTTRRLSLTPRTTHRLAFATGLLIACLAPPALLMAGCGLAHACL